MICVGVAVFGVTASTAVAGASAATVKEAGSSLVFPLATMWSHKYSTNAVTTSSVGSGKGINLIQLGQVDIGASDAPMTSSQYSGDKSGTPIQIPWALSATGIGYNIPGIKNGLHLNGAILAQIFSGKITTLGRQGDHQAEFRARQEAQVGGQDHAGRPLGWLRRLLRLPALPERRRPQELALPIQHQLGLADRHR